VYAPTPAIPRGTPTDPRRHASPASPWSFDVAGRTASVVGAAKVRQFIETYLFTAPGERVNRPTYGAGVVRLVFGGITQVEQTLRQSIQSGLAQELLDLIDITAVESTAAGSELTVTVRYRLRVAGPDGRADQTATLTRPLGP
jgi:phage baseplate assembly protein W